MKCGTILLFFRYEDGVKFLESTEPNWIPRNGLVHHVWWHKTLFLYQLGRYEEAMTLLDQEILPVCKKSKKPLALADATALLLRLEMEFGKDGAKNFPGIWDIRSM